MGRKISKSESVVLLSRFPGDEKEISRRIREVNNFGKIAKDNRAKGIQEVYNAILAFSPDQLQELKSLAYTYKRCLKGGDRGQSYVAGASLTAAFNLMYGGAAAFRRHRVCGFNSKI